MIRHTAAALLFLVAFLYIVAVVQQIEEAGMPEVTSYEAKVP